MAYTVKKRCVYCRKVLDENGHCTNPKCVMSKIPEFIEKEKDTMNNKKETE